MALKNLMVRLQSRAADTPDTSEINAGYQRKAPIHAGCTPDTSDTPCLVDTRANTPIGPFGGAVNDPANDSTVATVAVAASPDDRAVVEVVAAIDTALPDADRWCYPHSDAMNTAEIDRFGSRLVIFMAKGLAAGEAEVQADKLVARDRDGDDRRVCLECSYLSGWNGRHRCRGLQHAGMSGPLVSAGQVAVLQRCNGFKGTAS